MYIHMYVCILYIYIYIYINNNNNNNDNNNNNMHITNLSSPTVLHTAGRPFTSRPRQYITLCLVLRITIPYIIY